MMKKHFSTGVWIAEHPNTGQNIQHSVKKVEDQLRQVSMTAQGSGFYLAMSFNFKNSLLFSRI